MFEKCIKITDFETENKAYKHFMFVAEEIQFPLAKKMCDIFLSSIGLQKPCFCKLCFVNRKNKKFFHVEGKILGFS
jgi:hypothetical protein